MGVLWSNLAKIRRPTSHGVEVLLNVAHGTFGIANNNCAPLRRTAEAVRLCPKSLRTRLIDICSIHYRFQHRLGKLTRHVAFDSTGSRLQLSSRFMLAALRMRTPAGKPSVGPWHLVQMCLYLAA